MDSAATMKVTKAELKQAMEEMPGQAPKTPSAPKALEPVAAVQESPKSEKPVEGKSSVVSKIDPTVATILGVALVLTACICSCALVIAAIAYSSDSCRSFYSLKFVSSPFRREPSTSDVSRASFAGSHIRI
jgi:hypothetical protein